jgi:dimeric dUTPase (all-alpha-NTP-PPase superfamily)
VTTDRLAQMFALQLALESDVMYPGDFPSENIDRLKDQIRTVALALIVEVAESLQEAPWKPWAVSVGTSPFNKPAYTAELVDVWHFFINLCLLGNVTADDIYAGYMRKQRINRQRQLEGYSDRKDKCAGCGRDVNEPGVQCGPVSTSAGIQYRWCSEKEDWFDDKGTPLPASLEPVVDL